MLSRLRKLSTPSTLAVLATLLLAVTQNPTARATQIKEKPWLPEAAAYRTTLFLANLAPVPWKKIALAWSKPYRGGATSLSALQRIEARSSLTTDALSRAIASEDRDELFEAITRLLAGRIEEELDRIVTANTPAEAQRAAFEAQGLYRAFADHLVESDPQGARVVGRAWLDLSTSIGSQGLLGAGVVPPDKVLAASARKVISNYLAANYLVEDFKPRAELNAIPETVAHLTRAVALTPSLPPGSNILDQDPLPRLVLNFEERGIDESDLPLVAYGDMLFDSPEIFGDPARSLGITCSTCHNRSDINNSFFVPGASHQPGSVDVDGAFFNPLFNDRRDDPIDIPSLRGLRFSGPYGRDGRFASLRDFSRNVIVNEFGGEEPTPFMLDALVAYMLEFDFLPNSMLTQDGNLTNLAPEAARRGEVIFKRPFSGLGGKSCASCHVPSGSYLDKQAHDIGSVSMAYKDARAGGLDTPTLLGIAYTAPYFHDGSLPTLTDVVNWFNETKSLGLDASARADLLAYLETVGAADDPFETFDDRNTPFRLAFEELTTFASALDTLLPLRDAHHIGVLVDTVAPDLAADASTMRNLAALPDVHALANRLTEVGRAVRAGDWASAERSWAAFKTDLPSVDKRAF